MHVTTYLPMNLGLARTRMCDDTAHFGILGFKKKLR